MIILGIDPGTRAMGYGLIDCRSKAPITLDFGAICPPATLALHERYVILYDAVKSLIAQYHPTSLAIERQFISPKSNIDSIRKLGMATGVAVLAAAHGGLSCHEYAPSSAKLAIVGNGKASKEQVQKMIQLVLRLPQPPTPCDAADALAIAICHLHHHARIY